MPTNFLTEMTLEANLAQQNYQSHLHFYQKRLPS